MASKENMAQTPVVFDDGEQEHSSKENDISDDHDLTEDDKEQPRIKQGHIQSIQQNKDTQVPCEKGKENETEKVIRPDVDEKQAHPSSLNIDRAWNSASLTSNINGQEIKRDISFLNPVKIQFLLKYQCKLVENALSPKGIGLIKTCNKEEVQISDISASCVENTSGSNLTGTSDSIVQQKSADILSHALNAFEELVDQITVRSLVNTHEDLKTKMIETISLPGLVNENVATFLNDQGVCVVGFKNYVVQAYEMLKHVESGSACARHVEIDQFWTRLLTRLEFVNFFRTSQPDTGIRIDALHNLIMLDKATPADVRLLSEKMESFRCAITLTEYRLPVPKIELLKLPETQKYIQNLFERETIKCFIDVPDGSETVFLYTLAEDEGQTAALIIKTSIQKITARRTFMESEEFKDILKKYPGELIVNQWSSNNACRLCCTNDVLVEVAIALMPKDREKEDVSGSKAISLIEEVDQPKEKNKDSHTLQVDQGSSEKLEFLAKTNQNIVKPVAKKCVSKTQITKTRSFDDLSRKDVLSVDVYTADILKLDVECIVNPSNEYLGFGGGLSFAIARAAGNRLEAEAKKFVKKNGNLPVGKCISTTAGNLPYKYVIHTVGPLWADYKDKQKCADDLKFAVMGCLELAETLQVQSIGIPSISAGIFGVPKEVCAAQYVKAVQNFRIQSTLRKSKLYLKKILFIDINEDMCTLIKRAFSTDRDLQIRAPLPSSHCKTKAVSVSATSEKRENIHQYKSSLSTVSKSLPKPNKDTDGQKDEVNEDCCICLDKISDPKWLPCKHVFCSDCIDQQFKFKPACPQCGSVHGKLTGDQPPGTMTTNNQYYSLPGYEKCRTIAVTYTFPSGRQSTEHPHPGKYYSGIERTGYLPDNEKGRLVAKLLRIAFDRKLVFTIGRSVTTGSDGVITWNDIGHKTRTHGGAQSFGYPDPTYLDRVLDDLACKGVTKESLNDP